jgi:hypothetical protein
MGAALLRRRRRQGLPGLPGRQGRNRQAEGRSRQADRDGSGAQGPIRSQEDRVGRQAVGVGSAVCGEAPGALTLDDLIAGTWEDLSVCEVVRCPACGGKMVSRGGGTASGTDDGAPHGDCVDCGTQLC